MRGNVKRACIKWLSVIAIVLFATVYIGIDSYFADEDPIEWMNVDQHRETVTWDSARGPLYEVNYNTGELIQCTCPDAKVISCSKDGNIVTITVYSSELPEQMTYVLDLTASQEGGTGEGGSGEGGSGETGQEDSLTSFIYDELYDWLIFDTNIGPEYTIKLSTGEILSCSSDRMYPDLPKARIISYERKKDIVTLCVVSAELPRETTYVLDLSQAEKAAKDEIENYIVYTDGFIEFDSTRGPWYRIDYKKKEVVGCTSEKAKIIDCQEKGNKLTLTLYSEELPVEATYTFDLKKNVMKPNEDGMGWGEFDGKDMVEYFNILSYDNTIEFDSEHGPYYKIDLKTGEIVYCTSDDLYPTEPKAKVIHCSSYGNHITLTVYSAELPYEMTYVFNIKNHKQVCGVADYDKKASDKEISNIIDKIHKGNYKGTGVDKETMKKIQQAKKDNKTIVTVVETSCVDKGKVDEATKDKVEDTLDKENLESVQYMEISIVVYADGEYLGKITELDNAIDFTLEATDEIMDTEEDFYVVRVHEDEVDVLETEETSKNNVTFETDRFSTYVLVYKKTSSGQQPNKDPQKPAGTEKPGNSETTETTEQPEESEVPEQSEILESTQDVVASENTEKQENTETQEETEKKENPEKEPSSGGWIVVLILVLLAAGGGGAYWYVKNKMNK